MINAATLKGISPTRPLHLHSYEELLLAVKVLFQDAGVLPKEEEQATAAEAPPAEYTVKTGRKLLEEKGYQCSSHKAFTDLVKRHKVQHRKRGRDNWYNGDQMRAIPRKK